MPQLLTVVWRQLTQSKLLEYIPSRTISSLEDCYSHLHSLLCCTFPCLIGSQDFSRRRLTYFAYVTMPVHRCCISGLVRSSSSSLPWATARPPSRTIM